MFLLTARTFGTEAAHGVAELFGWKLDSIPEAAR
jgi:hypothetical protein